MDIEQAKESIIYSLKSHPMDNRRRMVKCRLQHLGKMFAPAYKALLESGQIYETGSGAPGSAVSVELGPAPAVKKIVDTSKLPYPLMYIDPEAIIKFSAKLGLVYLDRGWDVFIDLKAEINKALSEYEPKRPY